MSSPATQIVPVPTAGQPAQTAPDADSRWKRVGSLPCSVSIEVAVPGFTLKDLLKLRRGTVLSSDLPTSSNIPMRINGELIAWCEFEAMGNRLSIRLADLA